MVEHRGGIQKHFEDKHSNRRRAKGHDDGELDGHRQQDFYRVKAQTGGHVEFQIRMMHAVQPPESRNGMEHHVLEIDRKVERQHRYDEGDPGMRFEGIEQPPATLFGDDGECDRHYGKRETHQQRVYDDDAEIVAPAQQTRNLPASARRRHLPERHRQKDAEKESQADQRFVRQQ